MIVRFGVAGLGASIPAPGDHDGDGKTGIAVDLPRYAEFAHRPSSGGRDVIRSFGRAGGGQAIPIASIPAAQPVGGSTTATRVVVAIQAQGADIPLPTVTEPSPPALTTADRPRPGVAPLSLIRIV